MRKSDAPSMRHLRAMSSNPNIQISEISSSFNQNQQKDIQKSFLTPQKENFQENHLKNHAVNVFSVLYSKITTKKHKTWEGDGFLEIKNSLAILKDTRGSVITSEIGVKRDEIFEGNVIIIGTKEVEIQEKINSSSHYEASSSLSPVEIQEEPQLKKQKTNTELFIPSPNLPLTQYSTRRPGIGILKSTSISCSNSLTFPLPTDIHQQKFNERQNPVVEVQVSSNLVEFLRPHQREGVIFLYECILGYKNENYFGAILADEMGLGKSLQCLTLCHTLLRQGPYGERILQRILIAAPSSLIDNWENEIRKWLRNERMFAYVVNSKNKIKDYTKRHHVPFVIASYEMIVNNLEAFDEFQFDLLICDEGHRLKNSNIKTSIALRQLNIKRKIILSGTPIQNDLQEFYMLIDFVNPGILGTYNEYKRKYENPIVQAQDANASEEIKIIAKEKAEELNKIIGEFVLRRTQSINNEYLPGKREFIIFVRPSELQEFLLRKITEWYESKQDELDNNISPLQTISFLKKVCNHPSLLKTSKKDTPLIRYLLKLLPPPNEMGPFDSSKLELVQSCLQKMINSREKVVLVSNHTKTLDMLMGLCDYMQIKYLRLDGKTQVTDRNSYVEKFNKLDSEFQVFLLSAKAGGVGLNLSGASNLILFDNDWNPATDLQAMSRIWRDGQLKDVKIYRLITAGTIEEKILQRQIKKTGLNHCVMNQGNSLNPTKFTEEELKDLFSIQDDLNTCSTHELMRCNCKGNGEVNNEPNVDFEKKEVSRFRIRIDPYLDDSSQCSDMNMNELRHWKHYKPPIDSDLLEEIGFSNASDNIVFIFSCQTEFQKKK